MKRLRLFIILSALGAAFSLTASEAFDHTHARFGRVLAGYVQEARVDYAGLKQNPAELDTYLTELASVPPAVFKDWSEEERLAFLINLYNAQTLRLVINHYPLKSIRSIGTLPGAAWRIRDVRFGGSLLTLDHLENKLIRVDYDEPRIHFALVCAAEGCPPLRSEPYVGERLNDQLDDQARLFLGTPDKNRFDEAKAILWLSPIFKWYKKDFTDPAGSLDAYVQPFLPASSGNALATAPEVSVRYTDYSWSLNQLNK